MSPRIASRFLSVFLLVAGSLNTPGIPCSSAQELATVLKVSGEDRTPIALTIDDLKKMPRKTVAVVNPHDKKSENYEGALVEDLLRNAGVPQGEDLKGSLLASYLVFEAEDGDRVVFSIAELDSGIVDSAVIVADTLDGAGAAQKFCTGSKSGRSKR